MPDTSSGRDRYGPMTRRGWLLGSVLGGIGLAARAAEPSKSDPARSGPEAAKVDLSPILTHAKKVKLTGFRSSRSQHYVGVGNAPDVFRNDALRICEALAKEYLRIFKDPKFTVFQPENPLVVITMKDRRSYEIYLGESTGADVGGHYDLENNRLMIFDFAGDNKELGTRAGRVNLFSLVHEGLHQLCFNTGLLDRNAEIPIAISEGLAMYGEIWRPKSQHSFGAVNSARLQVLRTQDENGAQWYPLSQLLTKDELFTLENSRQVAYAEAWVLVHYLMSVPKRARFQAYLEALRGSRISSERVKDFGKYFGDLKRLDKDLRNYAFRQVRSISPS